MRSHNFIESLNAAINGIIHTVRTQLSMKIHYIAAILVLILSLFWDLSRAEFIGLCITITLVIVAELINTAIETLIDLVVDEYHPKAKIAKDVAAGAVLVTALNAVIVGYFLFINRIGGKASAVMNRIADSPVHITFIALVITLLSVVILKAFIKKGTPLQGGMPSGHSAVAFAVLTAVWLITGNLLAFSLCLVLTLLVIQSRLEAKVHNIFEVLAGGVVGMLITLLLFQLVGWQR